VKIEIGDGTDDFWPIKAPKWFQVPTLMLIMDEL
jgi:hypothetical protein